jgi:hypothetical protein
MQKARSPLLKLYCGERERTALVHVPVQHIGFLCAASLSAISPCLHVRHCCDRILHAHLKEAQACSPVEKTIAFPVKRHTCLATRYALELTNKHPENIGARVRASGSGTSCCISIFQNISDVKSCILDILSGQSKAKINRTKNVLARTYCISQRRTQG